LPCLDPAHQERLASGVLDGLRAYFHESAPPGTLLAEMKETEKGQVR
jgi:hypothetical protein